MAFSKFNSCKSRRSLFATPSQNTLQTRKKTYFIRQYQVHYAVEKIHGKLLLHREVLCTLKCSLKLKSYAGTPVDVRLTFFLFAGWMGLVHWTSGRSLEAVVLGIGFILVLFACVLPHDFGYGLIG